MHEYFKYQVERPVVCSNMSYHTLKRITLWPQILHVSNFEANSAYWNLSNTRHVSKVSVNETYFVHSSISCVAIGCMSILPM